MIDAAGERRVHLERNGWKVGEALVRFPAGNLFGTAKVGSRTFMYEGWKNDRYTCREVGSMTVLGQLRLMALIEAWVEELSDAEALDKERLSLRSL